MNLFSTRNKVFLFVAITALSPFFVFAQSQNPICSRTGYTIEALNGVFTNREGAVENSSALQRKLPPTYHNEPLTVDYILNPSHLGGLGDIAKAVEQKVFDYETVEDYDLTNMLIDASQKVKTQKLLLIGHSQGNFYANSIYDKLAGKQGGVPKESIRVYSVATPSARVAGEGKWLTSDTDKIISGLVARVLGRDIKKPNIHIDLGPNGVGHSFSEVYLKYQPGRIISDIEASLQQLKENDVQNEISPCFTPPDVTSAYKVQGALLTVTDFASDRIAYGVTSTAKVVRDTGLALGGIVNQTASAVLSITTGRSENSTDNNQKQVAAAAVTQNKNNDTTAPSGEDTAIVDSALISPPANLEAELPSRAGSPNLEAQPPSVAQTNNPPTPQINFSMSPGFGGGGGGTPAIVNDVRQQMDSGDTDEATTAASTTCDDLLATNFGGSLPCLYPPEAPLKPTIISPTDFSAPFATTTLTFVGTSSPGFIISNTLTSATTTADGAGGWTLVFSNLSEGDMNINFIATDLSGATSTPSQISFNIVLPRPNPPLISSPTFPLQIMNSQSITFMGSTTPGFSVSNNYTDATTTADSSGSWSFSFINLSEGTTTISFYATDMTTNVWPAGLQSEARTVSFNVFNYSPQASGPSVGECAYSLTPYPDCYLPAGQATLSWAVNSPNYRYFEIMRGTFSFTTGRTAYSLFATTTATSTVIQTTETDSSYVFQVRSVDIFGTIQDANSQVTFYMAHSPPVSITEVAWAGTAASPGDRWIELKNNFDFGIDLSLFRLTSDSGLNRVLSGIIPGLGYAIIDLSQDGRALTGVSTASTSVPYFLSASGDVLYLIYDGGVSTTTIDQTPPVAGCGGWCGGSTSNYMTMERRQVETAGSDKNNWLSNNATTVNGGDRNGAAINGTPGTQNSVSMGGVGFYCSPYRTSFVEGGIYLPNVSSSGYADCFFLSPGLSGLRVGGLYKGVLGNSTYLDGWYNNGDQNASRHQSLNIGQPNLGDNYFSVVRELHNPSISAEERASFDDFFTGSNGVVSPPYSNYEIINWKYGL
ncbi:MAG: hypothetical protein WC835_00030 [Candidatus Paceibacterota bacterium]|jgi:hypothetical protein